MQDLLFFVIKMQGLLFFVIEMQDPLFFVIEVQDPLLFVIKLQDLLFFVIEMKESHPANPALFLFTEIQNGLWEGYLYKMHFLFLSLLSLYPLSVFCPPSSLFFASRKTF